jgi:AcrR family transcriptional regulator
LAAKPDTRPTRKRLSAEDRRSAILDSALEVFSRRGYNGASIDEIAQAAGISKALIYEHFPSKKDLHHALVDRHVQQIFLALSQAADTSEPAEVRLRRGVDAFFEWVETHPAAFRLIFRDTFEADVAEVLQQLQQQATGAITALIASEPTIDRVTDDKLDVAIETYAQQLSGACQSLATWWQVTHQEVPRDFLVDRVMEVFWIGLDRVRAGERASR